MAGSKLSELMVCHTRGGKPDPENSIIAVTSARPIAVFKRNP